MKRIVFVCTGNTCRSPMAEALARQWAELNAPDLGLEFLSAGLAAPVGQPASRGAAEAMRTAGLDLDRHRAAALSGDMIQDADLILTMTRQHQNILRKQFPDSAEKVFALAEYASDGAAAYDISDPFGQPAEVYRRCAEEIKALLEKALARLAQ